MAENNHWVTTVMVTVVHPKSETPEAVADNVSAALAGRLPESWGAGEVIASTSVGTYIPDDEPSRDAGDDIPDWRPARP